MIAEADGDDELRAWLRKVIDAKKEIVAFVDGRVDGAGTGEFVGYMKGSFNLCLRVGFGDRRQSAIIRFPKPGQTVCRVEKVTNEVHVMEYLREHTTIPLPRVLSWGLTEESPQQLGPFIIMDFIDGTHLSTILKQPTKNDQEDEILNPDIGDSTLDIIYDQLADYVLQISRLEFSRIGAISKDHTSNIWSVTERPFTYKMNELATSTGYPIDRFPAAPFDRASDYLKSLANEHLAHLHIQRNLANSSEDAERRFIARHRFLQLIPKYCINDAGPFKVFCDDMQPSNMLVDPVTLRITALLDFEFTNAMPAQFAYDPPWWLLLLGPEIWEERYSLNEFLVRYQPKMEQFLRALERLEVKSASTKGQLEEPRLSTHMRDSWKTGRFWFNYAARKCLDVDFIYWKFLHEEGAGVELLDEETRAGMEPFKKMKMKQLEAYREQYAQRLL